MAGETCSVDGCDMTSSRRGMCNKHYLRWWKATPPEYRKPPTPQQRFWEKVVKLPNGCWEWTGTRRESGHGQFVVKTPKTVSAHSYSLEMHLGYPAPPGTEACHRCDNPPCVNPKHIYFGTRQDNQDDAWARGRHLVGEDRPAAVLCDDQVIAIREEYALGADAKVLAAKYGTSLPNLRQIVLGMKWKHLGGPRTRRGNRWANRKKVA